MQKVVAARGGYGLASGSYSLHQKLLHK